LSGNGDVSPTDQRELFEPSVLSGWAVATHDSIFDRYHVVASNDLREAALKVEAAHNLDRQKSAASDFVQNSEGRAQRVMQDEDVPTMMPSRGPRAN